jgi:acyl carrier protein
MDDELNERLENVLRMHLPEAEPDGEIPMDVPLVELGLDSLRAVNLVLDLEDTFDVEFPDAMLSESTFATRRALLEALNGLLSSEGVDAV